MERRKTKEKEQPVAVEMTEEIHCDGHVDNCIMNVPQVDQPNRKITGGRNNAPIKMYVWTC